MRSRRSQPLSAEGLYDYALKSLGRRAQSRGELRVKLQRRAEEGVDIESVLGRLQEAGYLNDRRFAETYATARLENQGLGSRRVVRDLRQLRVAPKLADEVVGRVFENTDEVELIDAFLHRKYASKNLPEFLQEEKNVAAAYRRLRYAGFSGGASLRVLRRYATVSGEINADELEPEGEPGT